MIDLEATKTEQKTSSLLVAFEERWLEPLLRNRVSVVFRKRLPGVAAADWLYLYVADPTSAIIGRARVQRYERMFVNDALAIAARGGLTREALRDYATGFGRLSVFSIGPIAESQKPIYLKYLIDVFHFEPPDEFYVLSKQGKAAIDKLGGWSEG